MGVILYRWSGGVFRVWKKWGPHPKNPHTRDETCGCAFTSRACIFTRILMKILLVNKNYLMSLSLDKDPSIGWGDIALFVTLYNLEDEILGVFSSWIIAKSKLSIWPLEMVILIILFDNLDLKPAIGKKRRRNEAFVGFTRVMR